MSRLLLLVGMLLFGSPVLAGSDLPKPMITGLKNPESVAIGFDGRIYITEIGDFNKDGDGQVLVVDKSGKAVPFATGLDDPKGMVAWQKSLFVTDNKRVWRIDEKGKTHVLAPKGAFPTEPLFLNDIAVDEKGVLYVSDSGDHKGKGGAIYRITQKGHVSLVADALDSVVAHSQRPGSRWRFALTDAGCRNRRLAPGSYRRRQPDQDRRRF